MCVCAPVVSLCLCTYGFVPLGTRRERPGGLNGEINLKKLILKKKAEKNIHKAIFARVLKRGGLLCVCLLCFFVCILTGVQSLGLEERGLAASN